MLILLSSDGENLESKIAKRFGHANYYIIFDTKTGIFESIKNCNDEHDHENLYEFLDRGVTAFIVGNIGPFAFEIINTPKSSIYLARKMLVNEAIKKFLNGELAQLFKPTLLDSIEHHHEIHHKHHNHYRKDHHGR